MSSAQTNVEARAEQQLQSYLAEAVEAGAGEIVLAYVPEGLEVMFMLGDTGAGRVLEDSQLAGKLIQLVAHRAELDIKAKGTMAWTVRGQTVRIAVEQYDSFGECAFRLKLKPSGGKPQQH
jgi:hypothetical protein